MTGDLYEYCRSLLTESAIKLTEGAECPIQLAPLLKRLGVGVKYTTDKERNPVLCSTASGAELIIIPRIYVIDAKKRPYARFLISHELAHVILRRQGITAAIDKSEYWKFEYLCDYFAQALLIPARIVQEHQEMCHVHPANWLLAVNDIRRLTDVNWATVTHRLAHLCSSVSFLGLKWLGDANRNYYVYSSTLYDSGAATIPRNYEKGRKIAPKSRLWQVLHSSTSQDPLHIEPELILEAFPSVVDPREVAAKSSSGGDFWHIAVTYDK